jgi:hypothetical protein
VILNESMGDAVKLTVIATGFQPEREPAPERRNPNGVVPVVRVRMSEADAVLELPPPPAIFVPPPAISAPTSAPPVVAEPAAPPPPPLVEEEPENGQLFLTGTEPEPDLEPESEPESEPEPEPESESESESEQEPLLDLDDLDTPAYLRQGRR